MDAIILISRVSDDECSTGINQHESKLHHESRLRDVFNAPSLAIRTGQIQNKEENSTEMGERIIDKGCA
jgi:hypothetical protein